MDDNTKFCPGCRNTLPLRMWGKRRGSPDGLQYRCKRCIAHEMRMHRERKKEAEQQALQRLREQYADEYEQLVEGFLGGVRAKAGR